ncbi:MAG: N-acetyl sugar amidotransferase [Bacteroidota bacterium]
MNSSQYQICSRCVMDVSDEDIQFDEQKVCNHCKEFEITLNKVKSIQGIWSNTAEIIKKAGRGKKYDCLIGISGGVDSCYTAYLAKKAGLRPLLFHMDNGWNSENSVRNIKKVVDKLDVDYTSVVLDWEEFKEIQLAFLKSSIVDIEMPTDIAILAAAYKTARKHGIKYILSGGNYCGEGILPLTWGYHVMKDVKLYRHIVRTYGNTPIKKVPLVGLTDEIRYKFIHGIKTIYPLNKIDYDKDAAKAFLKREYDWTDYGGKHHESRITAFWQSYAMPTKYNMDYRRATCSSLIVSGQMSREDALELLKGLPYKEESIKQDKEYVAKKFGISVEELNQILELLPKTYKDFPNAKITIDWFYRVYRKIFN